MYKKITAFLLIFILLFNFMAIEKVKAEPVTLGVSFLVFAALLTTFGVTVSSINDMQSLYGKFQTDLGTSFATFKATASMLYQSALSLGKNFTINYEDTNLAKFVNWVKGNFSEGNNEKILNEDYPEDINENLIDKSYSPTDSSKYHYYSFSENGINLSYKINVVGKGDIKDGRYSNYYFYLITSSGLTRFNVTSISKNFDTYKVTLVENAYGLMVRLSLHDKYSNEVDANGLWITNNNHVPIFDGELKKINYIGADVLTNPTLNPENVPFPPPPVSFPGIQETDNGRTYAGTPGQLVQDLENYPSVVEDMVKKYIGQNHASVGSIGSTPIYNEADGTLTFPTTSSNPAWDLPVSVDSPWDIPIEVPTDVPIPSDIPIGLGVIGWLLHYIAQGITGIWNFLTNLFSAPTKTISFDSLMNLDVKEKFPFCLPWDLYNSVATITSSPEVPIFETTIKNEPIIIDFTQFEELAKIARWAMTLIYSVSLIMISRRLIGGE